MVYPSVMLAQLCVAAVMTVTAYVPGLGGINGGTRGGYSFQDGAWVGGKGLTNSDAACGKKYKFGTIFYIVPKPGEGAPPLNFIRECNDRGGAIGPNNLDLAIIAPTMGDAYRIAMKWGKQKRSVVVCGPGVK